MSRTEHQPASAVTNEFADDVSLTSGLGEGGSNTYIASSSAMRVAMILSGSSEMLAATTRGYGANLSDDRDLTAVGIAQASGICTARSAILSPLIGPALWHDNQAICPSSAYARFVRGIRQIATSAMLSAADVFGPNIHPMPTRNGNEEVEYPVLRDWIHQLRLAEAEVPCPPIRVTEHHRIFPPAWEENEPIAPTDWSFLFVIDR
jgi:hypothetical protein